METLIEKFPSTEKLFGYAWILCWFAAIWTYHIQFFITGIFCLFLAYVVFEKNENKQNNNFPAVFSMDKVRKTLTVQKIYNDNLEWDKTEICSGDATLPSGFIKAGDVITDCSGNLSLRHVPTNFLFGAYNFE